jgi:hypothetical protein
MLILLGLDKTCATEVWLIPGRCGLIVGRSVHRFGESDFPVWFGVWTAYRYIAFNRWIARDVG